MTNEVPIPSISDYLVWPALALFVAGLSMALLGIGTNAIAVVGIVLILLRVVVFVLELAIPLDPAARFYILRDRNIGADVLFWFSRLLGARYIGVAGAALFADRGMFPSISIWPASLPLVAQIAIFFLLYELLNYWQHRLDHQIAFFWRMHAIHHSPTVMHHFKKDRHHLYYMIVLNVFIVFPLMYIGAPAQLFLWFTLWEGANSTVKHSNVRHKLPLILHYFVPSAGLHHIHHSRDLRQGNSNFANFPLLDVLFGTFTPPEVRMPGYGVPGDRVPQGFLAANIFPFTSFAGGAAFGNPAPMLQGGSVRDD